MEAPDVGLGRDEGIKTLKGDKKELYPEPPPFKNVEEIKEYYDKLLVQLSKYTHTRAPEYVELLVDNCLAEKQWDDALKYFVRYVRSEGLEISTDQKAMKKHMEKLFELRFMRSLIHSVGLGFMEEQIMEHEVDRLYGVRDFSAIQRLFGGLKPTRKRIRE